MCASLVATATLTMVVVSTCVRALAALAAVTFCWEQLKQAKLGPCAFPLVSPGLEAQDR
jgi:hypothetical protein